MCQFTEEARLIHDLHESVQDRDAAEVRVLSRALWRNRRKHKREYANNMILEAGANGCKPMDRLTIYIWTSAPSLATKTPFGVITDHVREIYTSPPDVRQHDKSVQDICLQHYLGLRYEGKRRVLPPREMFKVCQNRDCLRTPPSRSTGGPSTRTDRARTMWQETFRPDGV